MSENIPKKSGQEEDSKVICKNCKKELGTNRYCIDCRVANPDLLQKPK